MRISCEKFISSAEKNLKYQFWSVSILQLQDDQKIMYTRFTPAHIHTKTYAKNKTDVQLQINFDNGINRRNKILKSFEQVHPSIFTST